MHNKKIIAKGIIVATALSNAPVDSLASTIEEYKLINVEDNAKENKMGDSIKFLFAKIVEPIENLMPEPKDAIKVNENIVKSSVLEISLADDEFVPDLAGNPDGYETVKVTTTGNKKLVTQDYKNLKLSGIPKVDLSNASSDSIPMSAFTSATHLTEFKFPQGITSIGMSSFWECSGLTGDLVIPEGVTSIESYAFYNCSGFDGNLVIPEGVTSIGNSAFYGCSGLTGDLVIPGSVTSIGDSAFRGCSGFNGNLVIPEGVTSIGNYAFSRCSGFDDNLVIPEGVTSVGNNAFKDTGLEKIIVKIDETFENADYREAVVEGLPLDNTYLEMSYNFDCTNTWLENTKYKKSINVSSYAGNFENNEGMGVSLQIYSPYNENNISVTKDGLKYDLPTIEDGKYIFRKIGDYEVNITTDLGIVSNIVFKNTSPVLEPAIEYVNGNINIINNGILKNISTENIETFDNPNDLKFNFSNPNWIIENGVLKSEAITGDYETGDEITENEFVVSAKKGDKIQISIKTSTEDYCDIGYIYLNGNLIFEESGVYDDFKIIEFDLQEGDNTVKFVYEKDYSYSEGEDAIFIDYIKILNYETIATDCDTLEYRINGGEWQIYNGTFELNYPVGTKVQLEVRARHNDFVSSILKQEITVELNTKDIEEAVEKAEQSKEPFDIETARDLVNQLPECSVKDELQDRLNKIFPNLTLERETATANLDVYIKSENMLSMSLDTNIVSFEDYSGVEPMEKLNAVNITINSSLPYTLNAYLPNEISNADGSNKMDIDILNIKESSENEYKQFENTVNKLVLKDSCPKGNGNIHKIDLKLDSSDAHKADIYKTVIKFEAEQK